MTHEEMHHTMSEMFEECNRLRSAGQREYARQTDNAFGNFERIAYWMKGIPINRKTVLMVYALKHLDGILSYLSGHESQRENVRGRINDFVVYMALLRGMIDEEESDLRPVIDEWYQEQLNTEERIIKNMAKAFDDIFGRNQEQTDE